MRRVVFNQKGGVGKTSITCNLAAISAAMGYRTLVIDLDVQGNTTHYLVGEIDAEAFPAEAQGVAGLFKQTVGSRRMARNPDSFVWETPYENLYLMPSSPVLTVLEKELESRYKKRKHRRDLSLGTWKIWVDSCGKNKEGGIPLARLRQLLRPGAAAGHYYELLRPLLCSLITRGARGGVTSTKFPTA